MRLFFLLLLLGNLAYFAWHFQLGAYSGDRSPAVQGVDRTDPGVPGLVTLAERAAGREIAAAPPAPARPPEPATPVAPEPAPIPATPPVEPAPARPAPSSAATVRLPERCTVAGPYETDEAAESARAAANAAGIDARVEETARSVPAGFWVLLEGRYPIAEARRLLREMEDKGLRDIAITPLEDGNHAISLGIFSLQSTLDNRRRELIAQGYVPEVRERTRTVNAWSLRLRLEAEDLRPMTQLMNTLVEMDPRVEWRDVDCE